MRKIVATEYITVDGVMEDPGAGGWSHPYFSEEAAKFKYDELFASDALLLGRVTYEGFAAAWPTMTDTGDFGERMNSLLKYVVSTTLTTADWNNSHIIKTDVINELTKLKEQPGQDILLSGSATLFQALMKHNLIDEYRLMVHPIVLGSGKRLFGSESQQHPLQLVDTKPFSSGIVVLTYQPAAKPDAASGS